MPSDQKDKDRLELENEKNLILKLCPQTLSHCEKELMGADLHSPVVLFLYRFISSCIVAATGN